MATVETLPADIYAMAEFQPAQKLLLAILRRGITDIPIFSLIPESPPQHFILVRRMVGLGGWAGDPRFIDAGRFVINAFTQDPDGDTKGAILSEAVRVVLRQAWLEHWDFPGLGSVISIEMSMEPSRVTDWATSAGPVQYADLPNGFWRYESNYTMRFRKPRD